MDKKINVFLQSPWKFTDSPYYLYLRKNPPENVNYVNASDFKLIQNQKKMKLMHFIKIRGKQLVNIFASFIPNAHLTKTNLKYDIIHCAHCLSKNKSPWICDTEWVGQFWIAGNHDKHPPRGKVLRYLKSKHCKKILAWTKWSKEGILREFPEIKNKVELVYPAIPVQKFKKIKTKNVTLLFSSRRFYFKGGLYALEVIDQATKKYDNVEGIILSSVPPKIKEKYSKNKKIKFIEMVPQEKLFNEIYPKTDIFVYPSFTDTFGFQITEAMAFGIPVVSAKGHSRKELITPDKTGFVVDTPFTDMVENKDLENLNPGVVDNLLIATSKLIENETLRDKFSKNALEEISNGKFSISKRNEQLSKIYSDVNKNSSK